MGRRVHDLMGKAFGFWTVVGRAESDGPVVYWRCRCSCDTERDVRAAGLTHGGSESCGRCQPRASPHGHTSRAQGPSPTYRSWTSMIGRCTQPSSAGFEHYRRRNITVCERWRDFKAFLADMGERPEDMTLERSNNDLGYEPGNCVWATRRQQANNRMTNIWFEYLGRQYTLAELARETGVKKDLLRTRLCRHTNKNGRLWTVEEAVREPLQRGVRFDLR